MKKTFQEYFEDVKALKKAIDGVVDSFNISKTIFLEKKTIADDLYLFSLHFKKKDKRQTKERVASIRVAIRDDKTAEFVNITYRGEDQYKEFLISAVKNYYNL